MLNKKILCENIACYNLRDKIILVNHKNSRWYVIEEKELDIYTAALNRPKQHLKIIDKLQTKHFFAPLPEYKNLTLQFYTTNKCNLKCPHCYMRCKDGLENELSFEEKSKLIKDFCDNGGKRIVFTGGEVLMSNDFLDLLEYTNSFQNIEKLVLTNGTMWNDESIERCSKYANEIQISIDGYNEDTNSKIRGSGVFKKTLECIDKFINKEINVTLAMTPLYGFENEKEKYIEFGRKMVNKYKDNNFFIVFSDGLLQGRNIERSFEKNLTYAKNSEYILSQIYSDYVIGAFAELHQKPLLNCGYGKIVVDSNGDFTFCTCIKDIPKIGTIRNTDMKQIFQMAQTISKKTCIDYLEPCNKCDFRYICGDKCRMEFFEGSDQIFNIENIPHLILRNNCSDAYKLELLKKMLESFERLE